MHVVEQQEQWTVGGEGGEEVERLLEEGGLAGGRADGAAGGEDVGERR